MATTIQLLRSDIPNQRPDPGVLANGTPMVNTNEQEPGLFFSARDGSLIKIGPAAIGDFVPNSLPQGFPGNCLGEFWIDTSGTNPQLKFFDGSSFQPAFTAPQAVTSVGLTFSDVFTVSGSPITTTGTFTVTPNAQSPNTVFAGPQSGISAAASFRALVDSDIPTLPASKISSGVLDSGRIPSLDASKITMGTFSSDRIPNLSAAKITSGSLSYTVGGTGITAAPIDGELLIGSTAGGGWAKSTLTAGTNIGISNGGGSITISASTTPTLTSIILDDGGGDTLTLGVQNITLPYTLRFPGSDGTSGNVLVTDGGGDLSFTSTLTNITSISGLSTLNALGALTINAGGAANNIILEPTGGGLVQIGDNAPTSPALKDNVSVLETRVSDDSDYAEHAAAIFQSAKAYTVGAGANQLPAGTVGQIARVTDATAPAIGSTVAGGGAAAALCWYNGSNWTVIGV